ncbi:MAG TPA: hypothetical protein VGI14_05745 [Casimicrobiaceae bacterium]|jgi:hypothetical protein
MDRRAFLVTGTLGGAALVAGGWLHFSRYRSRAVTLDTDARAIVTAMVPAFLAGALPDDARRADAIRETVDGVAQAIRGLPPATRAEVAQLFGLLGFAPARIAMTRLWSDWPRARTSDVQAALDRWQASRSSLLRSAYDGLHQLILAAWYGNPRAWPAIGYAGPPRLG